MRRLLAVRELTRIGWNTAEIAEAFSVQPGCIRKYRMELRRREAEIRSLLGDFESVRRSTAGFEFADEA